MAIITEFRNNKDDYDVNQRLESTLEMYNKTKDEKYLIILDSLYYLKRVQYEIIIQKEESEEWKNNFGFGFWFVLNEFNTKPMIKDFMAKKMLDELYTDDEEFNLEKYLHSRFSSPEELEKIGIKKYILDSIFGCDECLNGYLSVHPELLSSVESKIDKIIDNWKKYEEQHAVTFDKLLDVTDEFVSGTNSNYTTVELAYYLKFALGYEWSDSFKELMGSDEFVGDEFASGEGVSDKEYYEFLFTNLDLENQKHLLEYRKYIADFVDNGKYPDAYVIQQSKVKKLQLKKKQ